MVELVQSYRELCNSIDRVAGRPFAPTVDVKADDFPVIDSRIRSAAHLYYGVLGGIQILPVYTSTK